METIGAPLEVLDPTAERHGGQTSTTSPRLDALEGKTVGLLWNSKAMGDVALKRVAELIAERIPNVEFRFYSGSIPCRPELLAALVDECDAAIACTADCGSCTSWMAYDAIQLERRNIPAVVIASHGFEHDLAVSARAFSMPDLQFVVVPLVYNSLTAEQAISQTDHVIDDVVTRLTVDSRSSEEEQTVQTWAYRSPDAITAVKEFNDDFMSRDWGDGYPLWPPSRYAVDELTAAIVGRPRDVVCLLPPGNGEATLEKIAINAAMAGCLPREMPIVVSAIRAIANIRPTPRGALMSTSTHSPLLVVNGPMGRAIGINGGRNCIGPGKQNEVNIRISRAIVLCLKNIGSWYPGVMDLDTIGTTRKHIVVVAENEDESPWEPYHVTEGYRDSDDTVTVFFTSGEWDVSVQGHTDAHQLARAIGSFSAGSNNAGYFTDLRADIDEVGVGRLLFLAPPHAIPIAQDAGLSKPELERLLWDLGQEPVSRLIEPIRKLHADGKVKPQWEYLFQMSQEEATRTTLPVLAGPELYKIVVVGSVRAKDLLMPTRIPPFTEPVSLTT